MPTSDELDELLGFPQGYTAAEGVTDLEREQLIGNTMHASVIRRILEDLPVEVAATPHQEATRPGHSETQSDERDKEGTPYVAPQHSTIDILSNIRNVLQEDPFKEVDATAIDVDASSPRQVSGTVKLDVHPMRPNAGPPQAFRPPDVENLSTWEYLQEVWDFEKSECKVPWGDTLPPPATVKSALDHMHDMGDHYGEWLETQLQRWETTARELREANPD